MAEPPQNQPQKPDETRRVDVEVMPPDSRDSGGPQAKSDRPGSRHSPQFKRRLALAFAVAAVSDGISLFTGLVVPVQLAVDLTTAILLFIILGWRWPFLPALIMEAVPPLDMLPAWVLVVGAIAVLGNPRPNLN